MPEQPSFLPARKGGPPPQPANMTSRAQAKRPTKLRFRGALYWCDGPLESLAPRIRITRGCTTVTPGPSDNWGSLPIEGGLEAVYRAELERAADPEKLRIEIEERLNTFNSPFRVAEAFLVEEIIDPRDPRPLLCEFANLAAPLRQPGLVSAGMRP